MLTKETAKSLAVAYAAHGNAMATLGSINPDYAGICCWGRMLKSAQEATGIILINADRLNHHINYFDREG